jgi:hypothetical protein
MIITKRHLPRRTILRGLGVTLALPLLDGMVPALTAAAPSVRRFGVFYPPNGMSIPYWYPKTLQEGPLQELPPTLQSLKPFKDSVVMCNGLADKPAVLVEVGGDHARASGTFLTGVPWKSTTGAQVLAATSVDQIAAQEFSKQTQLASLELGIDSAEIIGSCDATGTSCAFTNTLSWKTPTTPLPTENDPRAVFERLFGTSGSTDSSARLGRIRRDKSILDYILDKLAGLEKVVGPQDKLKVNEFLESVRDVERRITMAERQNARELPLVDQPAGTPSDFGEHARLLMDLLALAYQTDMTRVATFMLGREISGRPFPEIGVPDSHHPLSHHQDDPNKLYKLHKINDYQLQQFAHLVKKLSSTPEGDGTMLDSSILMYGTAISDSNTHFHDDLPIVLVGGRALGIKGGRYIRQEKGTPLANLHLTILETLGVPTDKFGDSTGRISGLS